MKWIAQERPKIDRTETYILSKVMVNLNVRFWHKVDI